ncbi:MAG: hypothetical protein IH961_10110 [Chloroflexi bacterium]|nr:hypothetical protein [Chloroflexota bacterium]
MPTIEELKASVTAEIDRRGAELVKIAKTILDHPEPGFREEKTSRLVAEAFKRMGLPFESRIALTGLKATLDSGNPAPTVGVMGELDSLRVVGHPHADPETTAAHACGHHCQIGMMLGVGMGLQAAGVMDSLAGRVALMAVPAEEYIDIEYRDDLRREGKLEFLGGKPEFIRLGVLDDVDLAMMTHTSSNPDEGTIAFGGTNNGIVAKRIQFTGREHRHVSGDRNRHAGRSETYRRCVGYRLLRVPARLSNGPQRRWRRGVLCAAVGDPGYNPALLTRHRLRTLALWTRVAGGG